MSKKTKSKKNVTDTAAETNVEAIADTTAIVDDGSKELQTAASNDTLDAELEALLEDATAASNDDAANDDVDLDEIEAQAAIEASKAEAYAKQSAEKADESTSADASTTSEKPKSRAPRMSRAAGAKPSQMLRQALNDETYAQAACLVAGEVPDDSLSDALNETIDSLAKKVGDKAVNLLRFNASPGKLQKYTVIGLNLLSEKGDVTSRCLTDALQSAGYTIGTARSQANQLMSLLPALKVATRSGRQLSLNEDSTIHKNYQAAIAA